VAGSYLHGMFRTDAFRRAYLGQFGVEASRTNYNAEIDAVLERLADHMESHLDVEGLLGLAR
jgi:adenosylcobyric acid synthase